MKKIILFAIIFCYLTSCQEKKIEFIHSKAIPALVLIKNPCESDSLTKKEIKTFLINNRNNFHIENNYYNVVFYRYTNKTRYFINNNEDRGGPTSEFFLSDYINQEIASFIISKCEKDTTKLVGKLYFSGSKLYTNKIDTLIYHCK